MNRLSPIHKCSAAKSAILALLFGFAFATNVLIAANSDSCATNSENRRLRKDVTS